MGCHHEIQQLHVQEGGTLQEDQGPTTEEGVPIRSGRIDPAQETQAAAGTRDRTEIHQQYAQTTVRRGGEREGEDSRPTKESGGGQSGQGPSDEGPETEKEERPAGGEGHGPVLPVETIGRDGEGGLVQCHEEGPPEVGHLEVVDRE